MPSVLSYYDKDGDGKVSTEELRELCIDASSRLRDAFIRLDPRVRPPRQRKMRRTNAAPAASAARGAARVRPRYARACIRGRQRSCGRTRAQGRGMPPLGAFNSIARPPSLFPPPPPPA